MIDLGRLPDDGATTFAEPGAGRGFVDRLSSFALTTDEERARMQDASGELLSAAAEQTRLAGVASGRIEALADAADNRIETVQRLTGQQLKNPFRQGYLMEAQRRYDDARGRGEDVGPRGDYVANAQRDIFNERLDAIAQNHPDQASGLQFFQPLEAQAGSIATAAEQRAAKARQAYHEAGGGVVGEFANEVLGGLWGSRRDPISAVSLFAGPTSAVGKTAVARVATSSLAQGFTNLGVMALERPNVQQWRAERGQDPGGALPSPTEVGLAFAMGAIPGAAVQGAIEVSGARALERVLRGDGSVAEYQRAAKALGVELTTDDVAAYRAGRADLANAAAGREPHPGSADAAAQAEAQALRQAGDPSEPPPPLLHQVGEGVDDVPARAEMSRAPDPLAAIELLRRDPALVESALASNHPEVQAAGKLASLSDQAWGRVQSGAASVEHAAIVADQAANPLDHAAVLDRVTQAAPRDAAEARQIAADHVEALAAKRIADELDERLAVTTEVAPATARGRAAADPSTWSLFEFLAHHGGLRSDPELTAILGARSPFVPGFGTLIRKNGRGLDDALRLAKEHGYMFDPADVSGAEGRVTFNDLLDRIAEENAGRKAYRFDQAPLDRTSPERDAHDIVKLLHSEIEATTGAANVHVDKPIEDRVVQIMTREGETDVLAAYERAIMEDAERYEAFRSDRQQNPALEIPGWDVPGNAEATSRDGRAAASGRRQAGLPDEGSGGGDGGASRNDGGGDRATVEANLALRDTMRDLPLLRDDGSVVMTKAADLAEIGAHEDGLANFIRGCQL